MSWTRCAACSTDDVGDRGAGPHGRHAIAGQSAARSGIQTVIEEGRPAPDFALQADDGSIVTLDSLKGRNVVLFFYPKDNTSG